MQILAPDSMLLVEVSLAPSVKQVITAPSPVWIVTVLAVCPIIKPLTV